MGNIINAIDNIIRRADKRLNGTPLSRNRVNSVGEGLEIFVKDAFTNAFDANQEEKLRLYNNTFSYLGGENNPPDAMIRGGEAIEVKKVLSARSDIALNSSYPKDKLHSSDSQITQACKNCEVWDVKDMIYVIGVPNTDTNQLKSIAFVYGIDYCANNETYARVKEAIKNSINTTEQFTFAETNELGRINRIDPLGITYFRMRGMWHISSPFVVFESIFRYSRNDTFNLNVLISEEKFNTFANTDLLNRLAEEYETFKIEDKIIPDPNNPAIIRNVKHITYHETH